MFSLKKEPKRNEKSVQAVNEIAEYLTKAGVIFRVVQHPRSQTLEEAAKSANVAASQLLRCVLLQDDEATYMAVLPSDRLLDFSAICKLTGRELVPVSKETVSHLFPKCEVGSYPPFPDLSGVRGIIDTHILSLERVYFEPGTHDILFEMNGKDFIELHKQHVLSSFSSDLTEIEHDESNAKMLPRSLNQFLPARMRDRVEEIVEMPAIPAMAAELLELRGDPEADSVDLANIIEKDPSLAAQLISWSQSPYYRYGGKVSSVEDAIVKVLGYDLVMNLALGIAVSRSLCVPLDGPLGLRAYWEFSIYTSAIVEALVNQMPIDKRPMRGLAYLAGLLHNFGHLILAHAFPPHFYILNHYVELNPHVPITKIERHVLGVSHQQIGSWLASSWHLPAEITSAVRWHHQEEYTSEFAVYSNLVFVATRLLKRFDIGDAETGYVPLAVLEFLGLQEKNIKAALDFVIYRRDDLSELAKKLT